MEHGTCFTSEEVKVSAKLTRDFAIELRPFIDSVWPPRHLYRVNIPSTGFATLSDPNCVTILPSLSIIGLCTSIASIRKQRILYTKSFRKDNKLTPIGHAADHSRCEVFWVVPIFLMTSRLTAVKREKKNKKNTSKERLSFNLFKVCAPSLRDS